MIPDSIATFFAGNQEALWLTTLLIDLAGTVLLYRLFGKAGLQVAIALGAAKYVFKIGIAMIDTVFIYWAKLAYGQRHPAEE